MLKRNKIYDPPPPIPRLLEYEKLEIPTDPTFVRDHLLKVAKQMHAGEDAPDCRFKKIQAVFRRRIGVKDNFDSFHYVPAISLEGFWLHDAGFLMGNYVRVYALDKVVVVCEDPTYIKSAPMTNLYKQH